MGLGATQVHEVWPWLRTLWVAVSIWPWVDVISPLDARSVLISMGKKITGVPQSRHGIYMAECLHGIHIHRGCARIFNDERSTSGAGRPPRSETLGKSATKQPPVGSLCCTIELSAGTKYLESPNQSFTAGMIIQRTRRSQGSGAERGEEDDTQQAPNWEVSIRYG